MMMMMMRGCGPQIHLNFPLISKGGGGGWRCCRIGPTLTRGGVDGGERPDIASNFQLFSQSHQSQSSTFRQRNKSKCPIRPRSVRGHGSEDVLPQGKRSLLPVVDCLSLLWKKFHLRLSESHSIELLVFFHNNSPPGVRQPPPLPHLLIPRPETGFHRPLNGQLLPHGVGGGTFVKPISLCVAGGHQGAWLQHHQLRTGVVGDSDQDGQVPSLKS